MVEAHAGYLLLLKEIEDRRDILHVLLVDRKTKSDFYTFFKTVAHALKRKVECPIKSPEFIVSFSHAIKRNPDIGQTYLLEHLCHFFIYKRAIRGDNCPHPL